MNISKTFSAVVVFGVIVLFFSSQSFAQNGERKKGRTEFSFEKSDKNQDKKISLDEFKDARKNDCADAEMSDKFKKIDNNQDGYLSEDEIKSFRKNRRGGKGKRGKGRKGGRGEGSNRRGGRKSMPTFSDFDSNNDGKITKEEFIESRGQRVKSRAKDGRKMKGLKNMPSFADIDKNNDGNIDKAEFDTHLQEHKKEHQKNH